ncbi:transcription factor GTE12-like isoform X2 [Andrographis paniculata]|uniref:transcription factor GTE12-like isoform X2 n=1 Tax=Andrographis paniculata TaxID=175694 RepID=UPI0021E7F9AD|nr:transcription factor GTE12-like isoform X2 [Andrographis paniculata]
MVPENQANILSCCPLQFPTMSTEENTLPRKLKFKITTKGIRNASEDKSSQETMKVVQEKGDRSAAGGKNCPDIIPPGKPNLPAKSCKRKLETSLDAQQGKRQKMDRGLKQTCSSILKELMNHSGGWIFSEPVDPVKLQIPDYFTVITHPMDLGTIRCKLEGNKYYGAEEFVSDVRLTFSNAVLYNPPGNQVHRLAKLLDGIFGRRWKSVEGKLRNMDKKVEQPSLVDDVNKNVQTARKTNEKNCQSTKPTNLEKAPLRIKLGASRPIMVDKKQKFRTEFLELLNRKLTGSMKNLLQKYDLANLNEERLNSFINSTSEETLLKLRRDIQPLLDTKAEKARPATLVHGGPSSLKRPVQKERRNKDACDSTGNKVVSAEAKCSSCFNFTCHCQRKNGSQASTSGISSERSSEHDHCGDSKLDSEVKHRVLCHSSSFGVDSDGPGVVLNEETSPRHSTPVAASTSLEGWNSFNPQMSPNKALRAAMLKSRFADTIFKATHQKTLDNSDPLRRQQEKARLEREQLEEKARIQAEIQAAKAASQRMQMQREAERAAARRAVEMMSKSVENYENAELSKELDKLCFGYPCYSRGCGSRGDNPSSPLERLGLYMKVEYCEEYDDEDAALNGEEGEIL